MKHTHPQQLVRRPMALILTAALAALANGPALAAAEKVAAADNTGGIEEVIVTARKREESSQKVPEAIAAISAEQIEQSFASTGAGLEGMSPSLVFDRIVSGPGTAALSIRGIGFSDVEKSFDPAVGVVLDGIYLGTSTGQVFQIFDMERIEVLRGPQGTLFGKNTIGGAINIVRPEPTGVFGGKMQVGVASRNGQNFDGVVNLPSFGDQLAVKLFYTNRQQDGADKNIFLGGKRVGGTDYESYGTALKWTPTQDLKFVYTYQKEDDNSPIGALLNTSLKGDVFCIDAPAYSCSKDGNGVVPATGDVHTVNQNGPDKQFMHLDAHTLSANWKLNDAFTLDYVYGLRKSDEATNEDFDATPLVMYEVLRAQTYKQESHELRLTYDEGGRFNLVTGLYQWDAGYRLGQKTWFFDNLAGSTRIAPNGELQQHVKHDTKSWAAFAQSDIKLTDEWIATIGGRYTNEKKTFEIDSLDALSPSGPQSTFGHPARKEWSKFTPKAGIRWQFDPEKMVYLNYSTGFRSGGFNGRAGSVKGATTPYDPETVNTVELGLKTQWMDNRVRFNADIYRSTYKNKQEDLIYPAPFSPLQQETLTTNAARAKFQGLEMELTVIPVTGWTLRANYAYLDAKYENFCGVVGSYTTSTTAGQCGAATPYFNIQPLLYGAPGRIDYLIPTDNTGLTLRRAPKTTFALNSTNVWQWGPGEATANIGVRYKSKYYTTFQNIPLGLADSAAIWDGSFSYAWDNWMLSVYGHNITDKKVLNSALTVAGLWSFSTWNLPREYGVTLKYTFGATK